MNKRQKLVQKQFLNNEEKIIEQLNDIYSKSLKDTTDNIKNLEFKIGKLQEKYDWLDDKDPQKARIKSQIQSKIYQKQYQQQLQKQLDGILGQLRTKSYLTVSNYLNECYTDGFIGTMFDLQGQGVPLIVPIDQEAMVRAVQLDSKISKGLYTHLGKDIDELKRRITAQVSRGISTGMSFQQVAKQLDGETRIRYNNAIRIARTEGHRIQCQAGMDACHAAKEKGADVVKQWDATLDGKTRESHQIVDGEIRELDKPFSNGLDFPGDPSGGASEVINCRCALLQRARWALEDEDEVTKMDNETGEIIQCKNYADFKEKYLSNVERQERVRALKIATSTDREQYDRYKRVLKDIAPKTFEDFVKQKHYDQDYWKQLKSQYRVVNQYKVDNGKVSVQQILDMDRKIIEEKRTNFASKYRRSGNIAGAYINDNNDLFIAHSKISTAAEVAKAKYNGTSNLVKLLDTRQFDYIDVIGPNGEIRTGTFEDTEAKLFEHLALLYEEKPFDSITLLSERGMCDSCLNVMRQFEKKYNVKVNAVSNKKVTGNVWGKRWRKS